MNIHTGTEKFKFYDKTLSHQCPGYPYAGIGFPPFLVEMLLTNSMECGEYGVKSLFR